MNILFESVIVIMGLSFVIFRKQLAHKTSSFYYRLLHVRFSEKGYEIVFLVGGAGGIIFGLLSIFHIL